MDRVAEIYAGADDDWGTKITRDRIHWMVQWARGPRVLDIGCSQGITAKLLRDKGCEPVGVDTDAEAIAFARAAHPGIEFSTELETVVGQFDTILLGEILEHLERPADFLRSIKSRLRKGGRVIVTVPHGFNECLDHRHMFMLTSFVELIESAFSIVELDFVDSFIRCVAADESADWKLTPKLIERAEADLLQQARRERAARERVTKNCHDLQAAIAKLKGELDGIKGSKSFRLVESMKRVRRLID